MFDELPLDEWLDRARAKRDRVDRVIAWLEAGQALADRQTVAEPEPPRAVAPRSARATTRDAEAKVLRAVIKANMPISKAQIVETSGLTKDQVTNQLQRLVKAGRVIADGQSRARRYRSAPREFHSEHRSRTEAGKEDPKAVEARVSAVGLRRRAMAAIAAEPDRLTEKILAERLNASRDDVADAVGLLLTRDQVHLNADGTYRRNGLKQVAA